MNTELRKLLIDQCRSSRPVYYEDVAKLLKLNLDLIDDRNILSDHLTILSKYEHQKGRPLISSVVIYKNAKDHGIGFYKLCEQLGIGKSNKLKSEFYGFTELEKAKEFWNKEHNFDQFYEINVPIYSDIQHPFFNLSEFDFFKSWAEKTYIKDNTDCSLPSIAIKCVLNQERKIDEAGIIQITKNRVLTVIEVLSGNDIQTTKQGLRHNRNKKDLESQTKLEF